MHYNQIIDNILKGDNFEDYKIIPINGRATYFHEFHLKGWNRNECLDEVLRLSSKILSTFLKFYKEKYAFTQPQLIYRPQEECFIIKIGIMDLDLYNEIYEKKIIENN